LNGFLREQPISDQGIDAHIEKAPSEVGTGCLIAELALNMVVDVALHIEDLL
jgi:hypothetical protein